ncbi:MAG: aminopeptidase P N-terminal domain-containing protein [Deltaproteobacteria bacterium]|nr:aminopeptidase P N-terminal domain-containing protein [Deltaproteobacteria bacterium]
MGPDAVAIFEGASLATRSRDTEYPFRQDSDFWYLTGFDHPNATAVLRTDGGPEYTLYVEPRNREMEIWTGHRPLGRNSAIDSAITNTLDGMRLRSRSEAAPANAIADPRSIVHEMRMFKEPAELDIMRRASAISREAHEAGAKFAKSGAYEYEIEAAIEYTFRRLGARGPAYTTIVGGGSNATVLHYVTNSEKLRDQEMVLVDAGCELEGYASDVTRTYPIGGRYTAAGRAIYDVVLSAHRAGIDQCAPGKTLVDVHAASVRAIVEGLVDLKLLSGDVDDLIENEAYRRFYMHKTSHWLGLDVHDVGNYGSNGNHRPLEPGMVFTVEPGIYVATADEDANAEFRGIGVRIEDDLAITEDGYENLTESIATDPEKVEALVTAR